VTKLTALLKPEYAEALQQVELDGLPVKDYAERTGVTANNAAVRIFRARAALREQVRRSCGTCADHGCLDCTRPRQDALLQRLGAKPRYAKRRDAAAMPNIRRKVRLRCAESAKPARCAASVRESPPAKISTARMRRSHKR
jgi:hypothetical protein